MRAQLILGNPSGFRHCQCEAAESTTSANQLKRMYVNSRSDARSVDRAGPGLVANELS